MKDILFDSYVLSLTILSNSSFQNGEHTKWTIDKKDRFDYIVSIGNGSQQI